jgi:hypothetical protein
LRASDTPAAAWSRLDVAERAAAPHVARVDAAASNVHRAEREAHNARIRRRLQRLTVEPSLRGIDRSLEIEALRR